MVSGLFAYLAALLVAALFLDALRHDPDLIAGFATSGFPDLGTDATFSSIGSPLGGAGGHLWLLGITASTLLGALGGWVGSMGRRAPRPPSRPAGRPAAGCPPAQGPMEAPSGRPTGR
jgi:hypothetical protein